MHHVLPLCGYAPQFQGRPVFRHDLSMPLEPLLATYCKWRGIELGRASFLWLQFYMRLGLHDTGVARGMDDGDTIYVYDKQVGSRGWGVFGACKLMDACVGSMRLWAMCSLLRVRARTVSALKR